jgi:hypothetical protein
MAELVALADKSGWFIVVIILAAWKFIPAVADKLMPEYMSARREADVAKRTTIESLTNKVIAVVENNSRTMSTLAMSMGSFERSLDDNTRKIYELGRSIESGGHCPLPDCPFMNQNKETG